MTPAPSPESLGGNAGLILRQARDLVDPELRKAVGRLPPSARTVAGYHFGWWDRNGVPEPSASGKALRPALALLACQGVGGRAEQALEAATAVELVHNMSLLHDDVIDGDTLRRHRPAAWSVFGLPAAILTGDALLSLAMRILSEAPAPTSGAGPGWLDDAVQQLVEGEFADTAAEDRHDVTLAESMAVAEAKTGSLIALSCALGALAGGADAARTAHLRRFGHHAGAAFQLVDDILGIWGDPQATGKPHLSDLRSRKKSLPVVAALTATNPASEELAHLYRLPAPLTETQLADAAALVEAAGGRTWAEREAERRTADATVALEAAELIGPARAGLLTLTRMISDRSH
ncbi:MULTISPECIES: polyprenyl synthetase family protein [unclassified Streptomyces]|uniref:polyprenyl synthetase family protein n=1 Tax=unclassified Streptomyces TaxID=2593676 RepID=UPI002DD9DF5A|nr:polyprenyl synthetase family protein [Streptomyces sp. NBC_01237]WRZ76423.1 polyprenyl synthetase family protein [Streptomyces sp. NBC_01237]